MREVVTLGFVTAVPTAPPALGGVCNLHGTILPVLDVGALLDQPPGPPARQGDGALVLEAEGMTCALRVDQVDHVASLLEHGRRGRSTPRGRPLALLDPARLIRRALELVSAEARSMASASDGDLDFDADELAMLRQLFRAEAHDALEAGDDARARGRLRAAVRPRRSTEMMRVTHTLKGAAGTVGLDAMVDLAAPARERVRRDSAASPRRGRRRPRITSSRSPTACAATSTASTATGGRERQRRRAARADRSDRGAAASRPPAESAGDSLSMPTIVEAAGPSRRRDDREPEPPRCRGDSPSRARRTCASSPSGSTR